MLIPVLPTTIFGPKGPDPTWSRISWSAFNVMYFPLRSTLGAFLPPPPPVMVTASDSLPTTTSPLPPIPMPPSPPPPITSLLPLTPPRPPSLSRPPSSPPPPLPLLTFELNVFAGLLPDEVPGLKQDLVVLEREQADVTVHAPQLNLFIRLKPDRPCLSAYLNVSLPSCHLHASLRGSDVNA